MNAVGKVKDENPSMKAEDFDRIMRQALQVKPQEGKARKKTKAKAAAKKKRQ